MSQLNLSLTDPPSPDATLWDQFEETLQQSIVERLARLLLQAACADSAREDTDD